MNGANAREKKDEAVVAFILVVAAFLRFYRIDQIPPGLHFDEAYNIADILNLLQGHLAVFFPANFGREPLYIYLSTVGGALFGAQALTLRLTSAFVGTATVLAMYAFARSFFRSRQIAALASFLLAISVWHIYYSRLGLRVILAVPLVLLSLFWFWRAVEATLRSSYSDGRGDEPTRGDALDHAAHVSMIRGGQDARAAAVPIAGGQARAFALAGLFASLAAYTYTSGRLLPLIMVALSLTAVLVDRINWRQYLVGLAITGVVAAATFAPLGYYFVNHPSDFAEHGSNLSITDPRVNHGDLIGTLWSNIGAAAGMFIFRGDKEAFRNVPFRPAFDPFVGALFLAGLGVLAISLFSRRSSRQDRLRAFFLSICLVVLVSPSALSDAPPNFTRALPALVFAIVLAAWAAVEIWNRLTTPRARRVWAGAVACALLLSTALGFEDYFVRFANDPALYYAFDVRMFDVSQWIHRATADGQIYLAPLWYQNGTLALLTRNTTLKSFESRDSVVLPSRAAGKDAIYAFPTEQEKKAATLAGRLGAIAHEENVVGSDGERLLVVYRVRVSDLPDDANPLTTLARGGQFLEPQQTGDDRWGDQLELIGHSIEATDPPTRNLEVTLYLRSLKPIDEDYTFSVKVRDGKDRVWGQEDKWPGDSSYATTAMSVGDLVVEKFFPGLNACAPGGEYRVTVEAYNPKTGKVASAAGGGNTVALGTVKAGASEGNRPQDLEIDRGTDLDIAPQLHLLGLTLTPQDLKPGDEFSLSLFWRGEGAGYPARSAPVALRDSAGKQFPLGDPAVPVPGADSGLCTFLDLRMPADAAAGPAALVVGGAEITTVNVER